MARASRDTGPHPVDQHVGRRIQAQRVASGYNQTELGQALGLTFQQIQKYEKGTNRVSASRLWDVANFLNVDVGFFFEGLDAEASDGPRAVTARFPLTRTTVQITTLAPRLSVPRQKLVADLMRNFAGQTESESGLDLNAADADRSGAAEKEAPSPQD